MHVGRYDVEYLHVLVGAAAEVRRGLLLAEVLQVSQQLGGALVAGVYVRIHGLERDCGQLLGDVRVELLGRDGVARDVLHRDLLRRVAVIWHLAREHLVHDDAEGVYVAARVGLLAARLLRRDVVHGADGLVALLLLSGLERGYAEVGDLDGAVLEYHYVLRLYVAVDDALLVRVLQGLGYLDGKMQGLLPAEGALFLHVLHEGHALDELHDDIFHAIAVTDVVDGDYVGVREHGDSLRLRLEALSELLVICQLVAQYLDCDVAVETVAHRLVHHRHAAGTYDFEYLISVVEHGAQIFVHVGIHRCLQNVRVIWI